MFKNKKLVIGGVVILVLLFLVILIKNSSQSGEWVMFNEQEVAFDEPVDVAFDFYLPWLEAARSADTDPYKEGLAEARILSQNLRARLKEGVASGEMDPVLCQATVPDKIGMRVVYEVENKAEILVMDKQNAPAHSPLVTLLALDGGWYIEDIRCAAGELPPEREFSFEQEGYLLKSDVPAPYDSQYWHLVFEENGQPGYVAPLFFNDESQCQTSETSTEATVCDANSFREATKVVIKGEMTEAGVEVKKLVKIE